MAHWQKWLRCLAQAVWHEVPLCIANLVPFGERFLGVGVRFRDLLRHEQSIDESRAALAELVTADPAAVRAEAQAIAQAVAADQSPQVQQNLAHYLELAPLLTQQSLTRTEDPRGLTVPPLLALDQPRNLLPFIPAAPPRFKPGDTPAGLNGWVLVRRLGVGGFGEVWQVRHPDEERLVAAVKFCLDDSARRLLAHEAKVIGRLMELGRSSPGIVPLLDFNIKADPPWLKYEFVEGGDLHAHAPMFFGSAGTRVIHTLAQIVGRFHRLDPAVVHRDLKPSNILLTKMADGSYRLRIADFGIGSTAANWALDQERLQTRPSAALPTALLGSHTPLYASPQQRQGLGPDPRDDVFALGVLWYQLLLGNLASERPSVKWRKKVAHLGLTESLLDLLEACCDDDPEGRPRDAAVLAEQIDPWLAGTTATPAAPPPLELPGTPSLAAILHHTRRAEELQRQGCYQEALVELDCLPEDRRSTGFYSSLREKAAEVKALQSAIEEALHTNSWKPFHRRKIQRWKELQPFRTGELDKLLALVPDWPTFTNSLQMVFALVPAGAFWMGGGSGKPGKRQATIPHGFYLGIHPVTQGQWQELMGNNPSWFSRQTSWFSRKGGGKDKVVQVSDADLGQFPVERVSWDDVQEFLERLNAREKQTKWVYRLPTEAEWEYACRGGASSPEECSFDFYVDQPSNALSSTQANFDGRYPAGGALPGANLQRTTKVGSYAPNPLGIYDLHGNVLEWCQDSHGSSGRVVRGGSWRHRGAYCRAAYRRGLEPSVRLHYLGFRVARVQKGS
jgi:formylglycine-generating enzyme required for sulfatase activity